MENKETALSSPVGMMDFRVIPKREVKKRDHIFADLVFNISTATDLDSMTLTLRNALEDVLYSKASEYRYLRVWVRTLKTSIPIRKRQNPQERAPRASGRYQLCGIPDLDCRVQAIADYLAPLKTKIPIDGMQVRVQLAEIEDLAHLWVKPGDEDEVRPIVFAPQVKRHSEEME